MAQHGQSIYTHFPPPPANQAWGELRPCLLRNDVDHRGNRYDNRAQCLDTNGGGGGGRTRGSSTIHHLTMHHCHHQGGNQLFRLNLRGQLASGERCVDGLGGKDKHGRMAVFARPCRLGTVDGPWRYDEVRARVESYGRFDQKRRRELSRFTLFPLLFLDDQDAQAQKWSLPGHSF